MGGDTVFFVGLRASGKTSLGRLAAERLGLPFADTDQLVVQKAGRSIAEIVEAQGWDEFRRLETEVLREVAGRPLVVATGGGIVLAEENRDLLRQGGPVFYLLATTLLVVGRLTRDMDPASRPPLTELPLTEEMGQLREERDPLYMEIARFVLHAEEPLEELVAEVQEKMQLVELMKRRR
ncbi:MAG: shikimate kinase AroL [Proteobacteria bacterium]|nr:shikimate kinase AroL [Pseudomonadota bacterium]